MQSNKNSSNISTLFAFSNHTGYLEDFNVHYYYFFIHPVATLTGSFMNIICTIVFAQKRLHNSGPFFQYSLVNSIAAALALALFSVYCLTRCGPFCGQAYTYWSQMYELYVGLFFDNSLYFAGSLIQISISFQLYFSITQRFASKKNQTIQYSLNKMNFFFKISKI